MSENIEFGPITGEELGRPDKIEFLQTTRVTDCGLTEACEAVASLRAELKKEREITEDVREERNDFMLEKRQLRSQLEEKERELKQAREELTQALRAAAINAQTAVELREENEREGEKARSVIEELVQRNDKYRENERRLIEEIKRMQAVVEAAELAADIFNKYGPSHAFFVMVHATADALAAYRESCPKEDKP